MPSPIATPAGGSAARPSCRVDLGEAARAAALMRGPSAAGPTMSPSTAPASTEASWPGSPTRISRASRRTASVSRAISESDTIEVSSTITTSCGRWFAAVVAEAAVVAGPPAEQPVERRRLGSSSRARIAASRSSARGFARGRLPASRAAALPVGAASATSGGGRPRPRPARRAARGCGRRWSSCRCRARRRRRRGGAARRRRRPARWRVGLLSGEQAGEAVGEHASASTSLAGSAREARSAATWRSSRQ